jgi:DNA gyrase/topoisomerase IV subunit A
MKTCWLHPDKMRALVRQDILALKEKYGDERRTAIAQDASGEFNEEDLIAQDNVLISYSANAYIKRMAADTFRAQGRGGRGIKGMSTRNEDEVIEPALCPHARPCSLSLPTRVASTAAASTNCPKAAAPRAARTSPMCSACKARRVGDHDVGSA